MFRMSNSASRMAAIALTALGVVAVGATASVAFSQKTREACVEDYRRLCPSYKEGSPQLKACMESNGNSVSPKCIRAAVDSGDIPRSKAKKIGY
jgi:hypothetical protein